MEEASCEYSVYNVIQIPGGAHRHLLVHYDQRNMLRCNLQYYSVCVQICQERKYTDTALPVFNGWKTLCAHGYTYAYLPMCGVYMYVRVSAHVNAHTEVRT